MTGYTFPVDSDGPPNRVGAEVQLYSLSFPEENSHSLQPFYTDIFLGTTSFTFFQSDSASYIHVYSDTYPPSITPKKEVRSTRRYESVRGRTASIIRLGFERTCNLKKRSVIWWAPQHRENHLAEIRLRQSLIRQPRIGVEILRMNVIQGHSTLQCQN